MAECAPAFWCEDAAAKAEVCPVADAPPSEGVSGLPSRSEDLSKVEASKSDISPGPDESFALEETPVSEAFPGLREPARLGPSAGPEVEAKSKSFLDEEFSRGALLEEEPFLQEEEPRLVPLELLPALHNPFAAVEAKLARLSSTVAQADAPQVLVQVGDAM